MGITVSSVSWSFAAHSSGFPGQWLITVTNAGRIASTFVPLEILVRANDAEIESIELLSAKTILTGNGSIALVELDSGQSEKIEPGGSAQYLLKLKLEGFDLLKGWDSENFSPLDEQLTLDFGYLAKTGFRSAVVKLPF